MQNLAMELSLEPVSFEFAQAIAPHSLLEQQSSGLWNIGCLAQALGLVWPRDRAPAPHGRSPRDLPSSLFVRSTEASRS